MPNVIILIQEVYYLFYLRGEDSEIQMFYYFTLLKFHNWRGLKKLICFNDNHIHTFSAVQMLMNAFSFLVFVFKQNPERNRKINTICKTPYADCNSCWFSEVYLPLESHCDGQYHMPARQNEALFIMLSVLNNISF